MDAPKSPFILVLKIAGTAVVIIAMYKLAQKFGIIESAEERKIRIGAKKFDELLLRVTSSEFWKDILRRSGKSHLSGIVTDKIAITQAAEAFSQGTNMKKYKEAFSYLPSLAYVLFMNNVMINTGKGSLAGALNNLVTLDEKLGNKTKMEIYNVLKDKPDF